MCGELKEWQMFISTCECCIGQKLLSRIVTTMPDQMGFHTMRWGAAGQP